MQSWLYFPSQVRYVCGFYIFDGPMPDNTLMMLGEPSTLHLHLSFHNTQEPQTQRPLLPRPTRLSPVLQDGNCFPGIIWETLSAVHRWGFSASKAKILSFISWLPVPGTKAHRPRGTKQPQRPCSAADKRLFSTSPFPNAQFRLKRINCGFPRTVAFPPQLSSWQQHTEGLAPRPGLAQYQRILFGHSVSK